VHAGRHGKAVGYTDDDRPRWGTADPRPEARGGGFAQAALSREVEDMQRSSGRELSDYIPTNFLAPEDRITRTETVEERAEVRRRMMASRPDRATEIRAKAALSHAIARETTIAGTSTRSRRGFNPEGLRRRGQPRLLGSASLRLVEG
jgi:hypothetical protein